MDKIEKLFRRITKKERKQLVEIIILLDKRDYARLDVIKITSTNFYRVRSGRFRIIFHKDFRTKEPIIDNITLRNEKTYRSYK